MSAPECPTCGSSWTRAANACSNPMCEHYEDALTFDQRLARLDARMERSAMTDSPHVIRELFRYELTWRDAGGMEHSVRNHELTMGEAIDGFFEAVDVITALRRQANEPDSQDGS